ncbi:MAG: cation-transporting P-type ATPase [Pseudomonadota bacterium]
MTKHTSDPDTPPWHSFDPDRAFAALGASPSGLSTDEAERRLQAHGPNRLPAHRRTPPLLRLLAQFNNLLIYVLLAAAATTAALGDWVDTSVIVGVVVINAMIGFIQEGKAEKALDAIGQLLSHSAAVRRDGRRITLPAEQLVPGDVVFLQSGDKVPADLRLFSVKDLRIDEATLTGESVPVEKAIGSVAADAPIGDRSGMAYSGTLVTYGQGSGVVVATGQRTEIGRISAMLGQIEPLTTPLLQQIGRFSRWLTAAIGAVAAATFTYGVAVQGQAPQEMFMAAVGLAVAAIPEGLPAIITITLAIGVQRMARRNAIIRRLPAVETLGSVTVICSDKTGTLTRNEMTVQAVATAEGLFEVTGTGYAPRGAFLLNGREVEPDAHPLLRALAQAALLCNDADLIQAEERWSLHGDPTEGALLALGMKAGLDPTLLREELPRTDVIPFESEHRFMATLHHDHAGHGFIYLKGAPERVLDMCSRQRLHGEDMPLDPAYWAGVMDALAGRGQRLLALAFKAADAGQDSLRFSDVEQGLTLLGLVGISDPPREEAVAAVARCRAAGIRVKMITGDHAATARAIGVQMGIGDGREALTGQDLEGLSDELLRRKAMQVDVFARASPEHKLRLVAALQAEGGVVAMTGDGVNDAPALKRANVGIAMGQKGTEVAKESAEMVLADDNFASIAHAVEEGRTVYDNIRKSLLFILPTNAGQALTIVAATAMGFMLPITPVQILWVNMVTAVTLALALAFEPAEPTVMRRPPRAPDEALLSPFLLWRLAFVSIILVAGTFGLFLWEWERGHEADIAYARTMAVNTLVMLEVFYLLTARYFTDSVLSLPGLTGNRYILLSIIAVLLLQLLFTYNGQMQQLFDTRPLGLRDWAWILLVSPSVFVLVELEKWLLRRAMRKGAARPNANPQGRL